MNRLPYPYGDCVKDSSGVDNIYTGFDYSPEGCYRSCFQRNLIRDCGCGDPRFPVPPGFLHCSGNNLTSRTCLEQKTSEAAGKRGRQRCNCGQPCDQSVYSVAFSASKWPSGVNKPSECNKTLAECIEDYRENAAMVEIFYEQLNYEALKETEAYGVANLLSDCGGQLGLWMGISVITCAEFCVLVWDMFSFIVHRIQAASQAKKAEKKRRAKSPYNPGKNEEGRELNGSHKEKEKEWPAAYTRNELEPDFIDAT